LDVRERADAGACSTKRGFSPKDETITSIIEIHSNVERSSLSNVRNPHHLNQFDIYENQCAAEVREQGG
jgi:hypothetical protein